MAGSVYKGWSLRTGTVLKLIPRIRASTKHETGIWAILFFLVGVYLFCIVTELTKPFLFNDIKHFDHTSPSTILFLTLSSSQSPSFPQKSSSFFLATYAQIIFCISMKWKIHE